jgi:hypothetical protein
LRRLVDIGSVERRKDGFAFDVVFKPLRDFGFEVGVWSAKKRVMFVAETKKGL